MITFNSLLQKLIRCQLLNIEACPQNLLSFSGLTCLLLPCSSHIYGVFKLDDGGDGDHFDLFLDFACMKKCLCNI